MSPTMTAESRSERWRRYYAKTDGRSPRETLLFALDRFDAESGPGRAVDLGCGGGRDTTELLRRGWSVLAIDEEPEAIAASRARLDPSPDSRLETRLARFEETDWPAADLVNSSFALPLCPPSRFPVLWHRIRDSLRPGGRFSGQLFGDRDGWMGDPGMTHMTRREAYSLLAGLEVEMFREEEEDAVTPRGRPKHWHVFHIVARKG
jgi:SAM-dependent methyltransferase